jgi:hypothetical protein
MPSRECKENKMKYLLFHFKLHSVFIYYSLLAPGPADFSLRPLVGFKDHDCNSLKRRAPQWTLGSRFKGSIETKSPGPATVNVDKITRFGKLSMPSTSMYKKYKENSK